MSAVDIVAFAALAWEARAVRAGLQAVEVAGESRRWRGRLRDGRTCLLLQTGMGAARATAAARTAPAADLFLSLGCGGGLVPWLRTGDLVVATEVVRLDTSCRPQGCTAAVLPAVELGAHAGIVASSPAALATTVEKTAAAGCGAVLVDMESWSLAAEADRRGIPLAVVRVVLDVASDELAALAGAVDAATGDIDPWRAARVLLPRPWTWPRALKLARQQGEAAERLGEAVAVLFGRRDGLELEGAQAAVRK